MLGENTNMTNILLDILNIDTEPFSSAVQKYIKPADKVCVVAFSFNDSVKGVEDWDRLYRKGDGYYYGSVITPLAAHGIDEDNVTFVNYFTDTAAEAKRKIKGADILVFPGGNERRMMERIVEFDLCQAIREHDGVVMGYSAGALIQLEELHSPAYYYEYPELTYTEGLGFAKDFYLEVHYEGTEEQNETIKRVLAERGKRVYAFKKGCGAIVIDGGKLTTVGEVMTFDP